MAMSPTKHLEQLLGSAGLFFDIVALLPFEMHPNRF